MSDGRTETSTGLAASENATVVAPRSIESHFSSSLKRT